MPKLRDFTLKSKVVNDLEFMFLKWLLNNLHYIKKLRLYLTNGTINRPDQLIWRCRIDANFIRQYCLPDITHNLMEFDFYITSKRQLPLIDITEILNSFKMDSFYISRQWTNVRCIYDSIESCQHLFSSGKKIELIDGLV